MNDCYFQKSLRLLLDLSMNYHDKIFCHRKY